MEVTCNLNAVKQKRSSHTNTTFSFTDLHRNTCARPVSAGCVLQPCGTGFGSRRGDWEAWAAGGRFAPSSRLGCVAHGQPRARKKHTKAADSYFSAKWCPHKRQRFYNSDQRCRVTECDGHHTRWAHHLARLWWQAIAVLKNRVSEIMVPLKKRWGTCFSAGGGWTPLTREVWEWDLGTINLTSSFPLQGNKWKVWRKCCIQRWFWQEARWMLVLTS